MEYTHIADMFDRLNKAALVFRSVEQPKITRNIKA